MGLQVFPRIRLVLAGFLTCLTAVPALAVGTSTRSLTFDERVAAQRAVEAIYWKHRIWPAQNPQPKPSLADVMPDSALRAKILDSLAKSKALEDWWQRPITGAQLQAELDRMARQSRDPGLLRELFAALGDNPLLVAETLARPLLADRLIHDWYATDSRFHADVARRAREESTAIGDAAAMKTPTGEYFDVTWLRESDPAEETSSPTAREHDIALTSQEWDEKVARFAGMTNRPGSLQEDADGFHVSAVLRRSDRSMTVATVTWRKTPFDTWWLRTREANALATINVDHEAFSLPALRSEGCTDDTWNPTRISPPSDRTYHTAVWTGTEMIVWSGLDRTGNRVSSGGRYNPATDSWSLTSIDVAPVGRYFHTAIWTGTEMIVWGGRMHYPTYDESGGRYNPLLDSWAPTSTGANVPSGRSDHTAVWSGTEMIVWGGYNETAHYLDTGGRYDPSSDIWTPVSTTAGFPRGSAYHEAVWTGSEMIIWGGYDGLNYLNTGFRYRPSTGSWVPTSAAGAPAARLQHTAIWTGSEMIVWGGSVPGHNVNTGGRYDPSKNTWVATSTGVGVPTARYGHTAIWTGSEMIVWGGNDRPGNDDQPVNDGGRYNPATNGWVSTSSGPNVPSPRAFHSAVWTGTEMIVWGGGNLEDGLLNTGGRYDPSTESWVPTMHVPAGRQLHAAAWTGVEMFVWGGEAGRGAMNSGGSYEPATDNWAVTSRGPGVPSPRILPSAVWTGSEVTVWGGSGQGTLDTGGRYDPLTDTWAATSTATGVPTGRQGHVAIWTGTEMIVWGGSDRFSVYTNDGGRYNPVTNNWLATSTTGAPPVRNSATAVWTGTEMIVWGGVGHSPSYLNTGGRYNPSADSWVPTSTGAQHPSGRASHSAIWTGTEMIVWGGYSFGTYFNTGGRYDPVTDVWTATSVLDSPQNRGAHTAVWTGIEMIVWGGAVPPSFEHTNTGGRYNPSTDHWSATSDGNDVPAPGHGHTAVWTGKEMIVWGGYDDTTYFNSGGRYCACHIPVVSYRDGDGDGFGDPLQAARTCDESIPTGYVPEGTDCDDADAGIHPGAAEACNDVDDDCNATVDDGGSALCDDGNPCTTDVCAGVSGCGHLANSDPCDDGSACTTQDTCSGGQCVGGPPPSCDDGDPCTDDSCDPAGGCVHPPGFDGDQDLRPDACDNCPAVANTDQSNLDADSSGDACDSCPLDAANDSDGDGVCGNVDNCAAASNTDQANADGDSNGDVCDPCPLDGANDDDGDGVCGDVDNCPTTANSDQYDTDGDGLGDACERAGPTDSDADGVPDDRDACDHSILDPTVIVPPESPPPPPPGSHTNPVIPCNSGVPNYLLSDGCTIADKIVACDAMTSTKNQFEKCVKRLLNQLRRKHVITERERRKIDRCVKRYKTRDTRHQGQVDHHGLGGGHDH